MLMASQGEKLKNLPQLGDFFHGHSSKNMYYEDGEAKLDRFCIGGGQI